MVAKPRARAAYLLREHVVERVAAAVAELEPVMLVKGMALAMSVYPQPWLRPMGDIDVLVKEDGRARVLAALSAGGFRVAPAPRDRRVSARLLGETAVVFPAGDAPVLVEVHHRLDKIVRRPIDYRGVFERARPLAGIGVLVPCVTDHALLVILHAALSEFHHEVAWRDLELLFGVGVDAEAFEERAKSWGLRTASWLALGALRDRGCPAVPAELVDALAPTGARARALGLFFRVGDPAIMGGSFRLGARWLLRQAPLCDDWGGWAMSVARYAVARAEDRWAR